MTTSKALVEGLQEAAAALRKAARWNGTGLSVDAKKDSFVFELLCYFTVALRAKSAFRIEVTGVIEGGGSGKPLKARWPRSHGLKQNFSYLRLSGRGVPAIEFQLCPGIAVVDEDGKARAPDINLLKGDCKDQPSHSELLACWDAKHTTYDTSTLPDTAVSDFIYTYEQLGSPSPPPDWTSRVSGAAYSRSGIFTNGQKSTEPDKTLAKHGVSETANFPAAPSTRP